MKQWVVESCNWRKEKVQLQDNILHRAQKRVALIINNKLCKGGLKGSTRDEEMSIGVTAQLVHANS